MIETILAAPVIIKVLASLALILIANSVCRHLFPSVLLGTGILAAWCGHPASAALDIAWARFSSPDNLLLMAVVLQVIYLSAQMSEAGMMRDLVEAVRLRISRRASVAALPAVIGFLPMPGGALFSAPLVESCDEEGVIPPLLKVQTNYWFRHVWEYWWPLYPGVLLALDVTGMDVWPFVLLMCPFSLFAIASGYWWLLRRIPPEKNDSPRGEDEGPAPVLLPLIAPIGIAALVYILVKVLLPGIAASNKYWPLMMGILLAMVYVQVLRRLGLRRWGGILLSRKSVIMVLLVAAVQVYGAFIEAELPDGTLLVAQMRTELGAWGIPHLLMLMILPLVAGFTTGLTIGFVGASFPIVLSLLGENPSPGVFLGGVALSYVSGFVGLILSPVHMCLVVTNEHFKTRLLSSLPGLVKPAVAMMLVGMAGHFLLQWI